MKHIGKKQIAEEIKKEMELKGWSLKGSRITQLKIAREIAGESGVIYHLASPKRTLRGYVVSFDDKLPLGTVWSTTRKGKKCVALGTWSEIKELSA